MLLNPNTPAPSDQIMQLAHLAITTTILNAMTSKSFDDGSDEAQEEIKASVSIMDEINSASFDVLNTYSDFKYKDKIKDVEIHEKGMSPGQMFRDVITNKIGDDNFHDESYKYGLAVGNAIAFLSLMATGEKCHDYRLPDDLVEILGDSSESVLKVIKMLSGGDCKPEKLPVEIIESFLKMVKHYGLAFSQRSSPEETVKEFALRLTTPSGDQFELKELSLERYLENKEFFDKTSANKPDLYIKFNNSPGYGCTSIVKLLNFYRALICTQPAEIIKERMKFYSENLDEIDISKSNEFLHSWSLVEDQEEEVQIILDYMTQNAPDNDD